MFLFLLSQQYGAVSALMSGMWGRDAARRPAFRHCPKVTIDACFRL
jgi:hypothetical protein